MLINSADGKKVLLQDNDIPRIFKNLYNDIMYSDSWTEEIGKQMEFASNIFTGLSEDFDDYSKYEQMMQELMERYNQIKPNER